MYYEYFNLKENPFRLNTDPRFLYLSKVHAQAQAYLEYALLNEENILVLSGEIGSGKSLIVQSILEKLGDDVLAVKIHQTLLTGVEFLQMLLLEFGIETYSEKKVELLHSIKKFLLQQHQAGRRVLLVIDEAQNLDPLVLEEIRFLADMDYQNHKLLNVFIVGQPELNKILALPEMEQLVQRIHLRFHLKPLKEEEVKEYILHRLHIASGDHTIEISDDAFPLIYIYTGGRPRLINVLCDHALTCAYASDQKAFNKELIQTAIEELHWSPYAQALDDIMSNKHGSQTRENNSAYFLVYKKKHLVGRFPLNKDRLHIGRESDNDIVLTTPGVSRHHAHVIVMNADIYIRDLDSKNGTYAGTERIELQALHHGDVVTISDFQLKFINEADRKQHVSEGGNILHYPLPANANK
jgi:type II secretory pathway predicted ATPase ExeA